MITQNFHFQAWFQYAKVKVQVIVFGYRTKIDSELSLPSNSMCHRKILTYRFCPVYINMTTLAGGFLVTNYHDAGHNVSKVTWTEAENKRDHYIKQLLTLGVGDH